MQAYSLDLRQRVVRAYEQGHGSIAGIAEQARTREELERALIAALELVTGSDCRGWFGHCGYQVTSNRN